MNRGAWDALLEKSVVGSFTSVGYRFRSKNWDNISGDAFSGRTLLITGATSGIGRNVAIAAAQMGAKVRFIARSEPKAQSLLHDLESASGHKNHRYYIADLSLIGQVAEASASVLAEEPEIHILINSAVVLPSQRIETAEGLELSHATNLVAPFLLTNRLKDRLVRSAPARIINVVSGGMFTQGVALDDISSSTGEYRGSVAYAQAKRRLMVLTKMWSQQLAGTDVTVNAVHPGWVNTPGVRDSLPMFHRLTRPLLRSPEQGADNILWLASSTAGGLRSGKLWHDRAMRGEYRLKGTIETTAEANQLWEILSTTVSQVVGA